MRSVQLPPAKPRKEHSALRTPHSALPWPTWAVAISFFKSDADTGVGDTVERIIGPGNSAKFKEWYVKLFGKSCGCDTRKPQWNANFPYKKR